jgi:enterochelin esterase-like enzyme
MISREKFKDILKSVFTNDTGYNSKFTYYDTGHSAWVWSPRLVNNIKRVMR